MNALLQALGIDPKRVQRSFNRMDWLEERIAAYMEQYPQRAAWLFDCFQYGTDCHPFIWKHDEMWRAHMEELLLMVAEDKDLDNPTKAEMLLVMKDVSINVPLHGTSAELYFRLFRHCLPSMSDKLGIREANDLYDYQVNRDMDEIRRVMRRERIKNNAKRSRPNPQRWRNQQSPITQEKIRQLALF